MDAKTWLAAKEWLVEAAAMPESERVAFLAIRCPDEPLRRELLEMLASDTTLSGLISMTTLTAGTRLGPYEIDTVIGAGGMGEVYRARDGRLGRDVAIKVLPALFATDRDRLARFEREAKLLASLNHPHICTLFDVGRDSGTDYIVMECIDGELLSDRLRNGPLPVDKAVSYAIQVADALDKAHALGIVHRDLKPGNIMVTKSGTKLLDFGLARSTRAPRDVTKTGTILGTLRYMSPEQLRGAEADARSDVWAFGCVLYQMLAGRTPFDSPSEAAIGAAILETEPPPVSTIVRGVPPALQRVIDRCLAKAPEDRWQSLADLRHELEWIAKSNGSTTESSPKSTRRGRFAWAVAALAILAAVAAVSFAVWDARRVPAPVSRRMSLSFADGIELAGSFALSHDGLQLAFVGHPRDRSAAPLIWVRPLVGDTDARPLPETAGGQLPFWSPDGRRLGFFADRQLKSIDVATGVIRNLSPAPTPRGGTWANNTILFVPDQHSGVLRISDDGGQPTPVTQPRQPDEFHRFPSFLADGVHFVFTVVVNGIVAVNVGSLGDRGIRELHRHDSEGLGRGLTQAQVAGGRLVFARTGSVVAQALDEKQWRLSGDEVVLAKDVAGDELGTQAFAVSDSTVVYRASLVRSPSTLNWISRSSGDVGPAIWGPDVFQAAILSPDDTQAVVARSDGSGIRLILWVLQLARMSQQQVTVGSPSVVWSPKGDRLFFRKPGKVWHDSIYSVLPDGSDERLEAGKPDDQKSPLGWSETGGLLYTVPGKFAAELWELPSHGDAHLVIPEDATSLGEVALTRKGDLIAGVVGRNALYVQKPIRGAPRTLVATGPVASPRWRADGHEIYFRSAGHLMAADVSPGNPVQVGKPRTLFDFAGSIYSPSQDGQRFLVAVPQTSGERPPVNIILNWTSPPAK